MELPPYWRLTGAAAWWFTWIDRGLWIYTQHSNKCGKGFLPLFLSTSTFLSLDFCRSSTLSTQIVSTGFSWDIGDFSVIGFLDFPWLVAIFPFPFEGYIVFWVVLSVLFLIFFFSVLNCLSIAVPLTQLVLHARIRRIKFDLLLLGFRLCFWKLISRPNVCPSHLLNDVHDESPRRIKIWPK